MSDERINEQNEVFEITEQERSEQSQIRRNKLAAFQEAGRNPFLQETWDQNAYSTTIKENFEEYDGKEVSIAGRMMAKRVMGKAAFIDIQDYKGRIQCHIKRDVLGEEVYKWFKQSDIGDIFGILSGACTVVITASVTKGLDTVTGKVVAVAVSAIISAIIVGGKAALKNLSITKSTELVIMFSKVLAELLPEKRKKKRNENPRKK